MNKQQKQNFARLVHAMDKLGFTYSETDAILRIERTLQRWAERECNGEIERDEKTGKPFTRRGNYLVANDPRSIRYVQDRESGALRRLGKIMEAHPDCVAHHQGDPRGCAVYILRKSDIVEGEYIGSVYSRGIACGI